MVYDVIIIGSGPAGLTAAIYTSRADLKTLLIAGDKWGGQLMLTTEVENYPGFSQGIMGPMLMEEMRKQCLRFGTEWLGIKATNVDFQERPFKIWADDKLYNSKSVILALGEETKWLDVSGEKQFIGRGISSCAPCDAAFFRGKRVFVVGGGDTAMEEALFLTKFAAEVTILHRRSEFRASKVMVKKVMEHEKIRVFWETEIEEFIGDKILTSVKLKTDRERWGKDKEMMLSRSQGQVLDESGEQVRWEAKIDGVFVAVGHVPSTELVKGVLELDEKGFLMNNIISSFPDTVRNGASEFQVSSKEKGDSWLRGYPTMSNVPGVFAVGDGFDYRYRQAITAAGFGCMGAMDAERWLADNG